MSHDVPVARSILTALGLEPAELSALGVGFASDAWLVRHGTAGDATDEVLRVAIHPDDPVTYPAEHAIMARLQATAAATSVPRPLAGSWELADWHGPAFSLTTFLPGTELAPEARAWAAEPIAAFLRVLHGLDVTGCGTLAIDGAIGADVPLPGGFADAETGVIDAWSGAPLWPFGGADLARHPAIGERPDLRAAMEPRAAAVRDLVLGGLAGGRSVVVHSDLHRENMLQDGRSVGFIDFGIAFVGCPLWEFAALSYFEGWELGDRTMAAYLDDPGELARWRPAVATVALSLGARRWEQDRDYELDEDEHNETFLRQSLDRI